SPTRRARHELMHRHRDRHREERGSQGVNRWGKPSINEGNTNLHRTFHHQAGLHIRRGEERGLSDNDATPTASTGAWLARDQVIPTPYATGHPTSTDPSAGQRPAPPGTGD